MKLTNKVYGIDLGTTNSLIGYKGKLITGLVPSIANVFTGEAGEDLRLNFKDNISRSFKVNMSTGKEGTEALNSSSLVLKELVRQVKEYNSDVVTDVVISVPAEFNTNQRQATRDAAKKLGLNVRALVSEPTAAAIAYNKENTGVTLVFDLGGGTFDVSVIDNRFGNYVIREFKGLLVGGDNLDEAIRTLIISKSKLVMHRAEIDDLKKLSYVCSQAKVQLQKERKDVKIDLSFLAYCRSVESVVLTVDEYVDIMKKVFKETIHVGLNVRNGSIYIDEDYTLLMVGGSTHCPYLQEWIKEEFEHDIAPINYDQDKIVALGATVCAQLVEEGEWDTTVVECSKALRVGLASGETVVIIPRNSSLPTENQIMLENDEESDKASFAIYQGDSHFVDEKNYIGKMVYDYGEVMPKGEGQLIIKFKVDIDGIVTVVAKTLLGTEKEIKLQL